MILGLAYTAAAEISGEYVLKEKGELRKLTVTEMKGINSLQFTLYVQKGDFSGNMFGLADLRGNTATYKTSGCQLTITFSGNKAVINNVNVGCKDYLKPGIMLDGTYLKK
jgi:hypothetical protein